MVFPFIVCHPRDVRPVACQSLLSMTIDQGNKELMSEPTNRLTQPIKPFHQSDKPANETEAINQPRPGEGVPEDANEPIKATKQSINQLYQCMSSTSLIEP